jgi:hypothetical protein
VKFFIPLILFTTTFFFCSCKDLERKAVLINPGDSKEKVISILGNPGDRQFRGHLEAWQYGETGAGFGYHDYRLIWFRNNHVTGIESYKSYVPATAASAHFRDIDWNRAP